MGVENPFKQWGKNTFLPNRTLFAPSQKGVTSSRFEFRGLGAFEGANGIASQGLGAMGDSCSTTIGTDVALGPAPVNDSIGNIDSLQVTTDYFRRELKGTN